MITKRNDYSTLLDDLRSAFELSNSSKNEEIEDPKLLANIKFSQVYCMAYKALTGMNEEFDDSEIVRQALSNYNIFNSFMNISVNEYKTYDNIGTGNIYYYPYETIAHFIFDNGANKHIFREYLDNEMDTINQIEQGIEKEKTKVLKKA